MRFDLLGHGVSPPPRHADTVGSQADLLASTLCERAVGPALIVGHSLGGLVAVALSERHPDKALGLILISTLSSLAAAQLGWKERLVSLPVLGGTVWRLAGDRGRCRHARALFAPGFNPPTELVADINRTGHPVVARSSKMAVAYWRELSLDQRLRGRLPVTVVFGDKDQTSHAAVAAETWQREGSDIVVFQAGGHSPHVELPEAVARLILRSASS